MQQVQKGKRHEHNGVSSGLLLLATGLLTILLGRASHDLSKHNAAVAIHEGNTGETLAILEGVAHERLLRLEGALSHLVGLQGVRILELLATGLLAHLPLERGDTAGSAAAAHKANWGISHLDLVGDVKDLNLGIELLGLAEGGVLLVDHDVTATRHVLLVKTLDVEADVVTRLGLLGTLVVHLHGEHLADARVGGGVGGEEDDFLTRLDNAPLDTAGQHITDTLDLVDTGDRHAHWCADWALWHAADLVEEVVDGVNVELLTAGLNVAAGPPVHVLDTHVLLPADLDQHAAHLVGDLLVTGLLVAGS